MVRLYQAGNAELSSSTSSQQQHQASSLSKAEIIRKGASRIVQVTDDEIAAAIRAYWTDTHNLAEGAGAAPLAAALQEKTRLQGQRVGLVLSGGNPVIVQSTGGVTQLIPAKLISGRKRLGRSLMLSAEQLGLTAQQVADVAEYLK